MSIDRRQFLTGSAALAAGVALGRPARARTAATVRIGACVVGLDDAKAAGLQGVEVGVGRPADTLEIAQPETQARYRQQMEATGLPICSLMMGLFNECPLATDPRAEAWMEQAIDAASNLSAGVILLAFFANGDLLGPDGSIKSPETAQAIKRIKAVAPRAADKGVTLAIENYLTARTNTRILNAIDHPAVKLYYDIYNTGVTKGYDVPAEIRALGPKIAQFHFKNGPDYLDKGNIDFPAIAKAIQDINYDGWIVLETSAPSKKPAEDAKRNGDYARKLFA